MTSIILCGGSVIRLLTISINLIPKQFVKLFHDKSLFQLTVEKNSELRKSYFIVLNSENELDIFDNKEEFLQKVQYITYLANEKDKKKKAENIYKKYLKNMGKLESK